MSLDLIDIKRLYRNHHGLTLEKRQISSIQKELMGEVKQYLETHPEGFDVELTDARDRTYNYHVSLADQTRAVVDKESLVYELHQKGVDVTKSEVTPGFLAEMVEQGHLHAETVRSYEDVSSHKKVKRVKRPKVRE